MATQPTPTPESAGPGPQRPRARLILAGVVGAALVGAGAGIGFAILGGHDGPPRKISALITPPPLSWRAGARPAPAFTLLDQAGAPLSLRAFHGRTTIVTFLDPLCRNICPLEARVLANALRDLPQPTRPALVAVSVNPHGDTPAIFRADARHWRLTPDWRWAVGSRAQLAAVWRKYDIEVKTVTTHHAGVSVSEVEHGDATFIVDRAGYERALFFYPFTAVDIAHEIRLLDNAQ